MRRGNRGRTPIVPQLQQNNKRQTEGHTRYYSDSVAQRPMCVGNLTEEPKTRRGDSDSHHQKQQSTDHVVGLPFHLF